MSIRSRSRSFRGFSFLLIPLLACTAPSNGAAQAEKEKPNVESSKSSSEKATLLAQATPQAHRTDDSRGPLPSLAPLVESVKAGVVNVDVQSRVRTAQFSDDFSSDFFDRFFGIPRQGPQQRGRRPSPPVRQGSGSGFIIHENGELLTNNHVVEGADNIRVRLEDGRSFDAEVLGRDPLTDLALLRLKGKQEHLPVVKLGDSDAMRVGDWVVAIGNPFGLASSVSAGIISARARNIGAGPYDDFLQTDAAINPGNSGGPLFNLKGEVIGINTAIVGGGSGIGFAVPSNMAKALLSQLQNGKIRRGWLGLGIQDLTPDIAKALHVPVAHGAVVGDLAANDGPAKRAGIKPDDVIVAIDGNPVESSGALTRSIGAKQPGSVVNLTLYRDGKKQDVKVELGERPDREGIGGGDQRGGSQDNTREKLGLTLDDASNQLQGRPEKQISGAIITAIEPGSVAEHADLRPGMVVVEAGGKPIRRANDLYRALNEAKSGSTVLLRIDVEGGRILRALPIP